MCKVLHKTPVFQVDNRHKILQLASAPYGSKMLCQNYFLKVCFMLVIRFQ